MFSNLVKTLSHKTSRNILIQTLPVSFTWYTGPWAHTCTHIQHYLQTYLFLLLSIISSYIKPKEVLLTCRWSKAFVFDKDGALIQWLLYVHKVHLERLFKWCFLCSVARGYDSVGWDEAHLFAFLIRSCAFDGFRNTASVVWLGIDCQHQKALREPVV